MTILFRLQVPLTQSVIARHEAISHIVRLIYHRGVSLDMWQTSPSDSMERLPRFARNDESVKIVHNRNIK